MEQRRGGEWGWERPQSWGHAVLFFKTAFPDAIPSISEIERGNKTLRNMEDTYQGWLPIEVQKPHRLTASVVMRRAFPRLASDVIRFITMLVAAMPHFNVGRRTFCSILLQSTVLPSSTCVGKDRLLQ